MTEERLQRVERELSRTKRRNRSLFGAVILCLGIGLGYREYKQTPTVQPASRTLREVRANKFILVDADGKTLAELVMGEFGPGLTLRDEKGKMRAWLSAFEDGPSLLLFDAQGELRALFGVQEDEPGLFLRDVQGNNRAQFGLKFGPMMVLSDALHPRASLAVHENGPIMIMSDAQPRMRAALALHDEAPMMILYDAHGKLRCTLGAAATTHRNGRKMTYPQSSIHLFGPDGNGLWSAP